MMQWLKHAFAIERTPVVPTDMQRDQIDRVCREIARRQLTLPVQMLLESSRPLNYVTGQTLRVFEPFLGTLIDPASIQEFAEFIEHPGAVEYICGRLETLQNEMCPPGPIEQRTEKTV